MVGSIQGSDKLWGSIHEGRLHFLQMFSSPPFSSGTYCRWTAKVNSDNPLNRGVPISAFTSLRNAISLPSAYNKLSLMCRDRAKRTTTETPRRPSQKLNHIFVCRNSLAFVFSMRQTGVGGKIKMIIEFKTFRQGWVRRGNLSTLIFFKVAEFGSCFLSSFRHLQH